MESITTAELLELVLALREDAANQFQYWLSISFALIAGATVGSKYLTKMLSASVGILYLLATLMLVMRYRESLEWLLLYIVEVNQRGALAGGNSTIISVSTIRFAVFFLGSALVAWFLFVNTKNNSGNDSKID